MAGINFDFTGGSLPAGITFTRASIGTYTNNAGTLITAGNDVARMNYVGGVSCLLIEGSATNLCAQSNNFLTAPWTQAGSCITTAAQFISPDGTNDGWTTTSGTGFGGPSQAFTFTAAAYTLSAWLKQAASVSADLVINVIDNVRALTPTLTRISATTTASVGTTYFATAVATNTPSVVMGLYGAQLELGSIPTSYIPTTTAAVTRAADSAVFTIPAGINQLVYTFDDNSTQTVAVSPGSYTIPTTLNRPNIKSVVGRYAFDFTSGSLPAGMTFTRPSIGTYTNVSGTLITAGNDVARLNYVSGVSNLLIEGSATNLLVQSNNFTTTWSLNGSPTVTAAQFVSPDGANNGWSLTSGSGPAGIYESITFSNIPYTASVWAKRIVGTAPFAFYLAGVDSGGVATSTTLTRLSAALTPPAGANIALFYVSTSGVPGSTDGIYGAQLETGSVMTSYIPTTTASVTRQADNAVFTIPSGVNALLYTFDDGSTQQVSVTPGSYTIPVNLSRPNIKSIQGLSGFDFTSGTLPPGITFTRASIGTYFDSGNILRTASNNVARMNYVGGVSCLLIEGSATNILPQSNGFTTTWIAFNGSNPTAAVFVSPDGTNNGWSIQAGAGSGNVYQTLVFTNSPYTISVWVKYIAGAATSNLNLLVGGVYTAGLTAPASLTRLSGTNTPAGGSLLSAVEVNGANPNTLGIYGAQIELGTRMSSYIPTTAAAVTRAVDQATFTVPAGVTQLTYTFDDNSTQTVSATPGSYTIPTTLNRPNIKSIAWISQAAITPTPSPARLGTYQSFGLAANIPLQLTAGGTYRLYILNTGPGNLFVSTGNTPGPNAATMLIPPLKAAPLTTTAGQIWLSSDQDGTVSIAAMPR